jgi:hypothetical protein
MSQPQPHPPQPEIEVLIVHPSDLASYWLAATRLLAPSIKYCHGKFALADIHKRLEAQTAFLWLTYRNGQMISAGVTWVDVYPRSRTLTLGFAGGDMDGLIEMIPDIKNYAEQLHCDAIECQGRSGWKKILKPFGFDKVSTTTRMEVAP